MKTIFLSLMICAFSFNAGAREGGGDKGLYLAVAGGTANHMELLESDIDINFGADDPEPEFKGQPGFVADLGYGYNILHVEGVYANLGDQGFTYGDYLTYEREVKIIGIAARWKWDWFSVRIGLGSALVNATITDTTSGSQSVTHDLDEGSNSYPASMFGLGLQIPVSQKFNLMIESNGFSWGQDDKILTYDDGAGASGEEEMAQRQTVSMLTVGLRWYWN